MNLEKVNAFPYILDEWHRLVKEKPKKTFVRDGNSSTGRSRAEVDDASSRIYAYLKGKGIGKEDFVMICLPRCARTIPVMLGVLKAGATFTTVFRS